MDSSPITPAFTIPFLRIKTFCPDKFLQEKAFHAATLFVNQQLPELINADTLIYEASLTHLHRKHPQKHLLSSQIK
jgi:hypothetical protein